MVSDISATLGSSEIKILFLPIEWMYLTPAFIGAEIEVIFLSTFWKNGKTKIQNRLYGNAKCLLPISQRLFATSFSVSFDLQSSTRVLISPYVEGRSATQALENVWILRVGVVLLH